MFEDALRIIEDRIVAWQKARAEYDVAKAHASRLYRAVDKAEEALRQAIGTDCSVVINGTCYTSRSNWIYVTKAAFAKGIA